MPEHQLDFSKSLINHGNKDKDTDRQLNFRGYKTFKCARGREHYVVKHIVLQKTIIMIKYYLQLFFMLACGFAVAQSNSPIITTILDGDCSGGLPKVIELYADGTVDFTQFSLEKQSNGGPGWGSSFDLSPFGTRTDEFVYVMTSSSEADFNTEFPSITSADYEFSGVANNNGDDGVRVINTSTTAVIDQYGVDGVRGSGEPWEYTNSYAQRVDGTGPDGGFVEANFTYAGVDALENECGNISSFVTLGSYTTTGSTAPELNITSPTDGGTELTSTVDVSINVRNFNVAQPSNGDGYIEYTVDGGSVTDKFDTNDFTLTNLSQGNHTISMELVDNSGNSLSPQVTANVSFDVAPQATAADINMLRAGLNDGNTYTFTGNAIVTFAQGFRNQFFIQDVTGAILVDDASDALYNAITRGDDISDIQGTIGEFRGQMQFTPVSDQVTVNSSGNTWTAENVTLAQLNANPEDYESELVTVSNVSFDPADADGANTFINGTEYTLTDTSSDTFTFYTAFFSAAYTGANQGDGDVIPSGNLQITGLITEREDSNNNQLFTITPRDDSDYMTMSIGSVKAQKFAIYPNPVTGNTVSIQSNLSGDVEVNIYNSLGQNVQQTTAKANGTISLQGISSGVYFVRMSQGNATSVQKLIVR